MGTAENADDHPEMPLRKVRQVVIAWRLRAGSRAGRQVTQPAARETVCLPATMPIVIS